MKNKLNALALAVLISFLPAIGFAQVIINTDPMAGNGGGGAYINCPPANGTTLCTIADMVIGYFNVALILLMSLAVLAFTYNVVRYFVLSDSPDKKEASQYVMYSVIGFFVILSLWGIVNILSNTFGGLDNSSNSGVLKNLPKFPTN